jgi:hypothetical protein
MRVLGFLSVVLLGCLLAAHPAPAETLAQSVTASANISALAKLSLSPLTVVFPDADPDVTPLVAASTGPVTITAKARSSPAAQVTLTLLANDDLRSGMVTIPVSALTWTATGDGFVGGTVSRTSAQLVGAWPGSGVRNGTQLFTLANSWEQPSGTYTVSLTYTLSAP